MNFVCEMVLFFSCETRRTCLLWYIGLLFFDRLKTEAVMQRVVTQRPGWVYAMQMHQNAADLIESNAFPVPFNQPSLSVLTCAGHHKD